MAEINIQGLSKLLVHQVHEFGEWIGFETRNKYQIMNENKVLLGYAAEQQKGILGFLLRQYLGHWRKFDVHFFNNDRQIAYVAHHPFRWFFERIEVRDSAGKYLGAIQKRFSILSKRFDIENEKGMTVLEVASPIWRIWTFTFMSRNQKVAEVRKKWSGLISEAFTDRDNFEVEFIDRNMTPAEKSLVLVSSVFVDLLYFERKR